MCSSSKPKLNPDGQNGIARDFYGPVEYRRIMRNLIMLGLSCALLFTAFKGMTNLQSSIEAQAGLGVYSLAALYAAFLVSSLFLPPICLAKLTCKWTIFFSISGYTLYIAAQFYPRFETMVPASVLCGLCSAPIWAGQAAYITMIAEEYSFLKGEKSDIVIQRFFGIFYVCYQSSQVFGNLISSLVLSQSSISSHENNTSNALQNLEFCGANFCGDNIVNKNVSNSKSAELIIIDEDPSNQNTLVAIFVGCALGAALVIFFFVDSLKRYGENERNLVQNTKWYSLFVATIRHWKKPLQILVIPMTIWFGMQEALWSAEFTKGYISCGWGMEKIGFVMICYGVCAAISSFIMGKVVEHVGRPAIFVSAALLNTACIITLLYWEPKPSEPILFFVLSGLWGIADGVWSPQTKALYGTLFTSTREAAFSNTGFWMSIGYMIVYLSSDLMCMESKLYMYLGFLALAMISYGVVEIITRSSKEATQNKVPTN